MIVVNRFLLQESKVISNYWINQINNLLGVTIA